jgi:hypothetical protein
MMFVKEIDIGTQEELVVDHEMLKEAGLSGRLRLLVQEGEIRILPEVAPDPKQIVAELAGCLGEEQASEYDFQLKFDRVASVERAWVVNPPTP